MADLPELKATSHFLSTHDYFILSPYSRNFRESDPESSPKGFFPCYDDDLHCFCLHLDRTLRQGFDADITSFQGLVKITSIALRPLEN